MNSDGWREVPIGELCVGIYDGPHATPKKTSAGPVFLGIATLNQGRLNLAEAEYLSEEDFVKWTRRVTPQPGDIVFSYETRLGETAIIPEGLRCCLGRRMALMRPDRTKVDPRFLVYAFLGPTFQETIRSRTVHGSTVERILLTEFPNFPILVPSLSEQRRIAAYLGAIDEKIELNGRMNETLDGVARAIFKSWFVDFDPVHAKVEGRETRLPKHLSDLFPARFAQSELGEIPEGWQLLSLDDIGRFVNGLALQKYPPTDGRSLPVIKIAQLRAGQTDGADRASADLEPEYVVQDGDILFSWSGSLECVLWAGGPGALNQHLFKVTSSEYPEWLCYFGIHQHLDEFRHIAAGKATTMGHIQRHHLSEAKLALPPPELLQAADSFLAPIIESTWRRSVQSRVLAELRDALLPKLVSGEIRLKEVERLVESAI